MTPSERERAEFEKWATKNVSLPLHLDANGHYACAETGWAFMAWQAARREERERVEELQEALREIGDYADDSLIEFGANKPLRRIMVKARAALSAKEKV